MNSKMLQAKAPLPSPRTELDVSHLMEQYFQKRFNSLIAEVEIKPVEQTHISLGNYPRKQRPQGFAIKPYPEVSDEELITQITKLEHESGEYELVLHVANYSEKIISIEVWRP